MVTVVELDTVMVVTGKVALVLPSGTDTAVGTVAADVLLDNETIAPPLEAGRLRVTVPVTEITAHNASRIQETPRSAARLRKRQDNFQSLPSWIRCSVAR